MRPLTLALLILLCGAASSGQPKNVLTGDRKAARLHVQATKLYQQGKHEKAKQKFVECINAGATGELLQLSHYNAGDASTLCLHLVD